MLSIGAQWHEARQAYVDAFPFYRQPMLAGESTGEAATRWLRAARLYANRTVEVRS